jgi:hypothetical protein
MRPNLLDRLAQGLCVPFCYRYGIKKVAVSGSIPGTSSPKNKKL